jgi:hypothetical protein
LHEQEAQRGREAGKSRRQVTRRDRR